MNCLALIAFVLIGFSSLSQKEIQDSLQIELEEIYEFCSNEASYPGGSKGILDYFYSEVNFDKIKQSEDVKIYVELQIEKNGSISAVVLWNAPNDEFKNEIVRVFKKMSNWSPSDINGRLLRTKVLIPLKLKFL